MLGLLYNFTIKIIYLVPVKTIITSITKLIITRMSLCQCIIYKKNKIYRFEITLRNSATTKKLKKKIKGT